MPKDKYYIELVKGERNFVYLTIRKDVLYKLLKLQKELKLMDFDYLEFDVINGYRHPLYNEKVGGAKSSWHIRGAALDIYIRDIDKNGKINKEDKKIVIDILNNKVIKNEGGIGRYPWSQVIHFDVRGYRARWDRQ